MDIDRDLYPVDEEEFSQTCWRDGGRFCSEECVAYEPRCEDDARWLPCTLLNMERAKAKSKANIVSVLKDFLVLGKEIASGFRSASKKNAADELARKLRETDAPPPKVTI